MLAERQKREKVRRHIVEEFVSTERSYIDKLNFLKKVRVQITAGGATGLWESFPPLFENMGLVICPNLNRNSAGWGGIENVIEDRLRRD